MRSTRAARPEFAAFRYPAEVITLAVRSYLRFNLSYRDLEELLGGSWSITPASTGG